MHFIYRESNQISETTFAYWRTNVKEKFMTKFGVTKNLIEEKSTSVLKNTHPKKK